MSMINEQVKELRNKADAFERSGFAVDGVVKEFRRAADTIEALSERLAEENKKQPSRYCGEEKQLIEAMAEEIENCYGRETELSERARDYLDKTDYNGGWIPCSERLPECSDGTETDVLMFQLNTGTIEIGYYGRGGRFRDSYFRHYRDCKEGVDSKDVIAWRPRPKLYKGEEVSK